MKRGIALVLLFLGTSCQQFPRNPADRFPWLALLAFLNSCSGSASMTTLARGHRFGSGNLDQWNSVTSDSAGNIYLAGTFFNTQDFGVDFGTSNSKTPGVNSAGAITKLNSSGVYQWTHIYYDAANATTLTRIAAAPDGSVYAVGSFQSAGQNFAADFGGTDTKVSAGTTDAFVTKITSTGSYGGTWTISGAGANGDSATAVAVDSSGNVYVGGGYHGTANLAAAFGGTDSNTSAAASANPFLIKFSSSGTYLLGRVIDAGVGASSITAIAIDSSGNVYYGGTFNSGGANFRLSYGGTDMKASQAGTADGFVSKMNADGSYGGTWRFGGGSADALTGLAVDSSGTLHAAGFFLGTVNFALDFGSTVNRTANGASDDGFYVSMTPSGAGTLNSVRIFSSSTAVQDRVNAVACDCVGNVYLAGFYSGSMNFAQDFGGTDNKTNTGTREAFVTRIDTGGAYNITRVFKGTNQKEILGVAAFSDSSLGVSGGYTASPFDMGTDFGTSLSKTHSGGGVYDGFFAQIR